MSCRLRVRMFVLRLWIGDFRDSLRVNSVDWKGTIACVRVVYVVVTVVTRRVFTRVRVMNSLRKRTLYSEMSDSVITVRNTTGEVTRVVEGASWREGGSLVEVM